MTIFNKILFPTDGSENSDQCLNYVKCLAEKFQAKVTVLNTYELPLLINNYEFHAKIYDEIFLITKNQSHSILDKSKTALQDYIKSIELLSVQGNAGQLIIDTAKMQKCDLIIMGSRGLGTVKTILLGSVSNYVIHHAQCPVMVIPPEDK